MGRRVGRGPCLPLLLPGRPNGTVHLWRRVCRGGGDDGGVFDRALGDHQASRRQGCGARPSRAIVSAHDPSGGPSHRHFLHCLAGRRLVVPARVAMGDLLLYALPLDPALCWDRVGEAGGGEERTATTPGGVGVGMYSCPGRRLGTLGATFLLTLLRRCIPGMYSCPGRASWDRERFSGFRYNRYAALPIGSTYGFENNSRPLAGSGILLAT